MVLEGMGQVEEQEDDGEEQQEQTAAEQNEVAGVRAVEDTARWPMLLKALAATVPHRGRPRTECRPSTPPGRHRPSQSDSQLRTN